MVRVFHLPLMTAPIRSPKCKAVGFGERVADQNLIVFCGIGKTSLSDIDFVEERFAVIGNGYDFGRHGFIKTVMASLTSAVIRVSTEATPGMAAIRSFKLSGARFRLAKTLAKT